jgi:GTPase SAR1 family protein
MATVSRLDKVIKGKISCAKRFVIYGPEGVGKSSLAADSPAPIFFDVDDGSSGIDVPRYKFRDDAGGYVPLTYEEVLSAIEDLTNNPHTYQTLVIDTADRLESLLWRYVVQHESGRKSAMNKGGINFESVLDLGYGNGFALAVEEWRRLAKKLDELRTKRNMAIVVLAHAQIRTFKNPLGEDYDQYTLRVNEKAGAYLREWADVTGFACYEETSGKLKGDEEGRAKGYSTGRRLLKLAKTATYFAKTRLALPDQVELEPAHPWAPLATAVLDSDAHTPATLAAAIEAELTRLGDAEVSEKARAHVTKGLVEKDKGALSRVLNRLKSLKPKEGKEEGQ